MTSIEQAIRAGYNAHRNSGCPCSMSTHIATVAIEAAAKSGHLIPSDDTEALIAALGATEVGWLHTQLATASAYGWTTFVQLPATDHGMIGSIIRVACADCPDCVPVYKLKGMP